MSGHDNYWTNLRLRRRAVIRGGALGAAGLAGAALIGCGGGGSSSASPTQAAATAATGQTASKGKVPADQVRVKPGTYQGAPPPTPAEQDPLANGRYGGTIIHRYLDPPHMDFNRTLSCTVNTTMD